MSTARIQPGLERIAQLVKGVTYPWNSIHVAGTNGKGSICHYASSLLTQRHIRCGKFTSPHLVDRWDCISVNNKTVQEAHFREVEKHYIQLDQTRKINASPFEILTATAFHIFNDEKVQIGVIEVGMGGKLDATNILDNQVISVISKIARDHEKFLGGSLGEITMHKAGILRPQVPFVVNPVNEWHVQDVVDEYAKEIGAGPRLRVDDPEINSMLYPWEEWHRFASQLRPFQKDNVVLAVIAVRQALESINESTNITKLRRLLPTIPPNPGRIQKVRVPPVFGTPNKSEKPERHILVDGAHNRDAAYALNGYVDKFERRKLIRGEMPPKDGWPVTWVLAMGQDRVPRKFLEIILQPGDSVVTTKFGPVDGMPWVTPKDPQDLLQSACAIRPNITGVCVPSVGALRAVTTAKYLTQERHPIVLTGSLYLVGQFFRELRSRQDERWWTDESKELDRALFREIHEEERARAYRAFGSAATKKYVASPTPEEIEAEKQQKVREEIERLEREMERLDIEEARISRPEPLETDDPAPVLYTYARTATTTSSLFDPASRAEDDSSTKAVKHNTGMRIYEEDEEGIMRRTSQSPPTQFGSVLPVNNVKIHKHYAKLYEGDKADGHPQRRRLQRAFEEATESERRRQKTRQWKEGLRGSLKRK